MSAAELILIVLVAMGAFWAGYLIGRASAFAPRRRPDAAEPEATPHYEGGTPPEPSASRARPRGSPPPAMAGQKEPAARGRDDRVPPHRSTKPPPAAAGLLDQDGERPPKGPG